METKSNNDNITTRPIPKPRRNVIVGNPNPSKTDYVNVKFQKDNKCNNIGKDEIDNKSEKAYQNLIDDVKKLRLGEKSSSTAKPVTKPRPVPAPRRADNTDDDKYENVELRIGGTAGSASSPSVHIKPAPKIPDRVVNDTSKDVNATAEKNFAEKNPKCSSNTFQIPSPPSQKQEQPQKDRSIFYEESDTSSPRDNNFRRSFSGSTNSGDSGDSSQKYKTSSPSDLLRSLGATSKLLTDSITERVTLKSKDARHKIDKNLRKSKEKMSTWGTEKQNRASDIFKNVRSKITPTSFTLRSNKKENSSDERPQTLPVNDEILNAIQFHSPLNNKTSNCEDLTTAESSYQVPKSQRYADTPSPSHSNKSTSIAEQPPPRYDEVFISNNRLSITDSDSSLSLASAQLSFERGASLTQSMYGAIGNKDMPIRSNLTKNRSESNIFILKSMREERSHEIISSSSSDERLPPPKMPAPILNRDEVYGKIRPVPPVPLRPDRHKKKSDRNSGVSNRATIDSTENRASEIIDDHRMRIFSRSAVPKVSAARAGNSDKSESWSFYDITNEDDSDSTSEPVYVNDNNNTMDQLYGRLCEMDSENDRSMLKPQPSTSQLKNHRESSNLIAPNRFRHDDDDDLVITRASISPPRAPSHIIAEFDPLINFDSLNDANIKDNKLLLLENLLNEGTYGSNENNNNYDETSSLSLSTYSDEDNTIDGTIDSGPTPPERVDSLNINVDDDSNNKSTTRGKVMIIHQNSTLRSDSIENLVDEATIEPFLAQTDEQVIEDLSIDLSRPTPSQSSWFVHKTEEDFSKKQKIDEINRNDHKNINKINKTIPKLNIVDRHVEVEPPPPYSESIKSEERPAMPPKKPKANQKPEDVTNQPLPTQPTKSSSTTSMKNMFSSIKSKMEVSRLKRKNSVKQETKIIIEMIPKAMLSQRYISHEGHLIRFPSGVVEDILKELSPRNAILREKRFSAYIDPQHKILKEQFLLEYITTIQCVDNHKTINNFDMYCFEITTALPKNQTHLHALSNPNMIISSDNNGNIKTQRVCHVYGVAKRSERNLWMQKLIESMTDCFPSTFTCEYTRAGWCYVKNSITSPWMGSWLLLSGRKLLFYSSSDMNLETMDLRKARCIVLKESDESINNLHVENGPILMIDCPPYTQYIIMNCPRETKIWRHIIKESAHNNGISLRRQQLTKDNVPVIVDKCVNFIYTHGSMSEGIYRKSGSEAAIQKLLAGFREDAFSVQLIRSDFNEHDVANVLKRFMRGLPEILLEKHATSLVSVCKLKSVNEKILAYRELLARLSIIEYQTLRKLLGHLNFIQSQSARNKMSISNLALVWGVTLLRRNKDDDMSFYEDDSHVIADLIMLYKQLFPITHDEVSKEQVMLTFLQKYHAAAENLSDTVKQSGDLKVWITIDSDSENTEEEEKKQVNVAITPQKTVYQICKELACQTNPRIEPHNLSLVEIILNGELTRPLHYSERVLDTILRWTSWPDSDRKSNYLKLTKNTFIEQLDRSIKMNDGGLIPNMELKFADSKTKSAKQFTLELVEGKIVVLKKDKNNVVSTVKEIYLTHTVAYIGAEKKRDQNSRWTITLIEKSFKKRSRDSPFIGHIIAGSNSNDQIIWYSHIWFSLFKNNILPNPEMIMT